MPLLREVAHRIGCDNVLTLWKDRARLSFHKLVRKVALPAWLILFSPLALIPQEQSSPLKSVLIIYDENSDFSGLAMLDRSFKSALGGPNVSVR